MDEKEGESSSKTVELFVENSIALQKVLTDVAVSMDNLAKEVKSLVDMFEEAGKSFVSEKHKFEGGIGKDEGLVGKLDSLVQQNKTIAKGLVLLEKTMREKETGNKPLPEFKF